VTQENQQTSDLAVLHEWLCSAAERGPIAIVSHKNGDMDTIGSACALSHALGDSARACGLHSSSIAKKILSKTEGEFHLMDQARPLWPRTLGSIVVVDAAAPNQVGMSFPTDVPVCAIDHHSGGADWSSADLHFHWECHSTAEMVFAYLDEFMPDSIDDTVRRLLLAGVITDTGRFRHANSGSLAAASKLVGDGELDYHSFVEEMESNELNHSQKVAIAKALSRVESIEAGQWFLLHTRAGTNEGVVARTLMSAGADVALVVRRAKDETRLVARASRKAVSEGCNLGEMMQALAQRLEGEGGGHPGAAGWSGEAPAVTVRSGFIADLSGLRRNKK
jgi:phosphoesterase RecJ-like protein